MEPNDGNLRPRPVSESKSEMIELVLPNDTNPLGALLGGRLMHWIDLAGALAAHRHSHSYAVTASMDHIDFLVPVHVGDMVILQSSVNRAFHTSMEVGRQGAGGELHFGFAAEGRDRLSNVCRGGPSWKKAGSRARDSRDRGREAALRRRTAAARGFEDRARTQESGEGVTDCDSFQFGVLAVVLSLFAAESGGPAERRNGPRVSRADGREIRPVKGAR